MIRRPSKVVRSRGQTERQAEDDAADLHRAAGDRRDSRQFRVNARICEHWPTERMAWPAQPILVGHETSSSASAVVAWAISPDDAWPEAAVFTAKARRWPRRPITFGHVGLRTHVFQNWTRLRQQLEFHNALRDRKD